ncbi:hypothetical protein [Allohahella marinimesophila]|uniref:Uncharacterized protein n=1 Tax=Allohahella marinimesophila TaxID=1054972 RepID=A0ABP7Q8D6_9GAMM
MFNEFKADLILGLEDRPAAAILKAMSYRNPNPKNLDRLKSALDDDWLGLNSGSFDLKYSAPEFLLALSKAAGLDIEKSRRRIEAIQQYLSDEEQAFKPYIWVESHFERKSQPIFALAACEPHRHLPFPKGFWQLALEVQLHKAKALARQHMAETEGTLVMWGRIQAYWLFHESPQSAHSVSSR